MKKKPFWDALIIFIPIIIALCVLGVGYFTRTEGGYVCVSYGDGKTEKYPLSKDTEVALGEYPKNYNTLVIEDGSAYISSASCPDKICVKHRRIKYEGERIVCLPNKLTVTIEGRTGEAPDITP